MKFFRTLFIHALLLLAILSSQSQLNAQSIQWQKSLGGTADEKAHQIIQTTDGGYIAIGYTFSNNGNVSGNYGAGDYWVTKMDASGNLVWQKCLGGTGGDIGHEIQQTSDGGYILMGYSASNNNNVSGNHGEEDFWVVKLDSAGNIMWQKSLGSVSIDLGYSIQQTADGGYIVTGLISDSGGNVNPANFHGMTDAWVVKLSPTTGTTPPTIDWEKAYGGTGTDYAWSIKQTSDGGYIFAGFTNSNDGDVSGNHGLGDIWVVKLNSTGTITWQKCLGGTNDEIAYSIKETSGGGYILTGATKSSNGDVTLNQGSYDYWLVKLNTTGAIVWQKTFGGSSTDEAHSVYQTSDGGYILAGRSASYNGNISFNNGSADIWVVKTDASGNLIWEKSLGGSIVEEGYSVQQTSDGMYIIAGTSNSTDGDVTGNHGAYDFWIVKLAGELQAPVFTPSTATSCSPIPFTITADPAVTIHYTSDGSTPTCTSGTTGASPINLTTPASPGTYIYKAISCQTGAITSSVSTGTYIIEPLLNDPVFAPPSGTSTSPIPFTITADAGATIHYTSDGSTPDCTTSPSGYSPISLITPAAPGTYTYKAIACQTGYTSSGISSATYEITLTPTLSAPIFNPASGTSTSPIPFTITADAGATIHYTSDGSTPDCTTSPSGYSPINLVTPSTPGIYTYKAIACMAGYNPSSISTAIYEITITPTLSDPVFNPPSKTSVTAIPFTITADVGTEIHYTADGTDPDCTTSPSGYSPISLITPADGGTYVYKAIACKTGYNSSGISSATYIVDPVGIEVNEIQLTKSKVNIYPNPSSGFVNIDLENIDNPSLVVYDSLGEIVLSKMIFDKNSGLDLSNNPQGVYYIKISGVNTNSRKEYVKTQRLILE